MARPQILVVDLRSQLTLNIARVLREAGYRTAVLDSAKSAAWLRAGNDTKGIILSGGDWSVYEQNSPREPEEVWTARRNGRPVPVLGICYGMHRMAVRFGGEVRKHNAEYDQCLLHRNWNDSHLLDNTPQQMVQMNHGDSVTRVPDDFIVTAFTKPGAYSAMEHVSLPYYAVQFHPESTHSVLGPMLLKKFAELCGCEPDWSPESMVGSIRESVLRATDGKRVYMGFSGGVDSTTFAAIVSPALGERLLGITIDVDNLRENELAEISRHAQFAGLHQHAVIDARHYVSKFAGIIDAEKKRAVFRGIYGPLLREAGSGFNATYFAQGTLAPDEIESGATGGAVIKMHHNVGLVMGNHVQLHPLRDLFKYEIRALARELGLPESVSERKPFPGPGLLVRLPGVEATHERLSILRWADKYVDEIVRKESPDQYAAISQLLAGYTDAAPTVGLKGDARAYDGSVIVRAIETVDFMTARGVRLSDRAKDRIEATLTQHRNIVRVWYDEMNKPPATTEFE